MPIDVAQIRPGVVVFLSVSTLVGDARLIYEEAGAAFRDGPFVCLQSTATSALWIQITSTPDKRGIRLPLKQEWRMGGSPRWRTGFQLVHDARKPIIGPLQLFADVSQADRNEDSDRPFLTAEGIEACLAEIRRYGKQTLAT